MHSGSIRAGDTWLRQSLQGYIEWAMANNSLLILTFDESYNDGPHALLGLTDPAKRGGPPQNRVATIFVGAHVKPGLYAEGKGITHVNILRTLEAMYGLGRSGAQQIFAVRAGITDDYIVTDVFESTP
jgi:acid phosphatase